MRKQRGECKQPAALCFWRLLCFHQGDRRCVLRSYLSLRRQACTHLDLSTQPLLLLGCIWCFFFTLLLFSLCARRLPPLFPPLALPLSVLHTCKAGWMWECGRWLILLHTSSSPAHIWAARKSISLTAAAAVAAREEVRCRDITGSSFLLFSFPSALFICFFFLDQGPLISTVLYHQ